MPASWAYGSKGHEDEQTAAGQREQFDGKAAALRALFSDSVAPAVLEAMQLVRSPPRHHRHRAQIAVVPDRRQLGMWDSARKEMVPIDHEAALFSVPILLAVRELQQPSVPEVLWRRLTNVHAHSTAAGDVCLTLCYARQGAPTRRGRAQGETRAAPEPPADEAEWRAAAQAFREQLLAAAAAAGAGREPCPSVTDDAPALSVAAAATDRTAAEQSSASSVRSCAVVGQWRKHSLVRETFLSFWIDAIFRLKPEHLPRQARDKHKHEENVGKNRDVSAQVVGEEHLEEVFTLSDDASSGSTLSSR